MSRVLLMISLSIIAGGTVWAAPADEGLQRTFEQAYAAWRDYIPQVALHSDNSAYTDNTAFEAMVDLGPKVVPLIIAQLKTDPAAHFLVHALARITHKRVRPADPNAVVGNQGLALLWVEWFEGGHEQTPTLFRAALSDWRALREKGETLLWTDTFSIHHTPGLYSVRSERDLTPLGDAYQRMSDLGIEALPLIVDAVGGGQVDLVALIPAITNRKAGVSAASDEDLPQRTLAWWEANKQDWLIPWPEETQAP